MATKQRTARKPKPEKLSRRDSAEYLRGEADIEAYFEAAINAAGDDPVYMLHVLNTIARAARGGAVQGTGARREVECPDRGEDRKGIGLPADARAPRRLTANARREDALPAPIRGRDQRRRSSARFHPP